MGSLETLLLDEGLWEREPLVLEGGVELTGGKEVPRIDEDPKLCNLPPLLLLTRARGRSSTMGTLRGLRFEEDMAVRGRRKQERIF